MHNRITSNIIICIRTQHNTDCWVISFTAFQFIVHTDIHIHLFHILMRDLLRFQINKNKTLQYIVVKHQINIIILFFCMNMLLSCHKSISFSKLHQKLLQIRKNAFLQVTFCEIRIPGKSQKFGNNRVFDKLQFIILIRCRKFFHLIFYEFFFLGSQHTTIVLRRNIALQCTNTPCLF